MPNGSAGIKCTKAIWNCIKKHLSKPVNEDIHYYSDIPEKQIRLLGPVVPCAEYALPSSSRLGENAVLAAKEQPECRAVILRCNGAVCMGVTDHEALETAETLEDVARRVYERRCGEKVLTEAGPEFVSESEGRYRLHIRTPYVMEMSCRAKTLQPFMTELTLRIFRSPVPVPSTLPPPQSLTNSCSL